ncbi:hypothetical protein IZY60_09865 [Lutibacter sp. B2]|nr:hypothetical protein [Lutibacter sp. B2]
MDTQNILHMVIQSVLNTSDLSTITESVMMINTIMALVKLAVFIFIIFYVYEDAPKYNMNKFLWMVIAIFVPNYIGCMTYLIIRTMKEMLPDHHVSSEVPLRKRSENNSMNKKLIYKVVSVFIVMTIFITAIYIVEHEKLKPEEIERPNVVKSEKVFKGEYKDFTGSKVKEIWFQDHGNLKIRYASKVKKGDLKIGLYEYNGEPIKMFETNRTGTINIPLEKYRIYKLIAKGFNAKGSYDFSWEFKKNK